MRSDYLRGLLERLPEALSRALADQDDEFAEEMALAYLSASPDDQTDHLAFICGGGPEQIRQARLKHEEGVPSSGDLEGWADGGEA